MTNTPARSDIAPAASRGTPSRAASAAWIGSTLEYYDFFIYGTSAALVFNKIFFPGSAPATGVLLALATFAVGYVARPLGGFVLGHVGDRYGRKRVLVFTIVMMGAATFLIGCVPTYASIGVTAPILLVVLRLLQGFFVAGDQAGANSMTLEHAPEHRRGYFTSFTLSGTQAGQILGTAAFLPVAALPSDQLLAWGWRLPFWISALVAVVGLVIRRTLDETPAFRAEQATGTVPRLPLIELVREHRANVLRVLVGALFGSVSTIFTVHALSYATNTVGVARTTMLWVGVVANIVALVAIPAWGRLSDSVGRRPLFVGGALACAGLMFAYLWAISVANTVLIFSFGILMFGIAHSAMAGAWPAYFGELFNTRVRLSGIAIGTQIGFAITGFAPTLATAIAGTGRDSWLGVSVFTAVVCAVAALAVATGPETFRVPTARLGAGKQEAR